MHLNKVHGILRRAGLRPYNPDRGSHTGYCVYAEQLPYDSTRYVGIHFRSSKGPSDPALKQAQEAAIASLSTAGVKAEVAEAIDGYPAIEFDVASPRIYRYWQTYWSQASTH